MIMRYHWGLGVAHTYTHGAEQPAKDVVHASANTILERLQEADYDVREQEGCTHGDDDTSDDEHDSGGIGQELQDKESDEDDEDYVYNEDDEAVEDDEAEDKDDEAEDEEEALDYDDEDGDIDEFDNEQNVGGVKTVSRHEENHPSHRSESV